MFMFMILALYCLNPTLSQFQRYYHTHVGKRYGSVQATIANLGLLATNQRRKIKSSHRLNVL